MHTKYYLLSVVTLSLCCTDVATGKDIKPVLPDQSNVAHDSNDSNASKDLPKSQTDTHLEPEIGMIADHTVVSAFETIPSNYVAQVIADFRIYYGHTSHGSQLVTGMQMLGGNFASTKLKLEEVSGDLGTTGDLTWETTTRSRLSQAGDRPTVVMWSWCGGGTTNTEQGVTTYLLRVGQFSARHSLRTSRG